METCFICHTKGKHKKLDDKHLCENCIIWYDEGGSICESGLLQRGENSPNRRPPGGHTMRGVLDRKLPPADRKGPKTR